MISNSELTPLLTKAFELTDFLLADRSCALEAAIQATLKLEPTIAVQNRQTFYRVRCGWEQTLQRLAFLECEPFEKEQEAAGQLLLEGWIRHYIKHMIRLIMRRNSFQAFVAIPRVLYDYGTGDALELYSLAAPERAAKRGEDSVRRWKGILMSELQDRFGQGIAPDAQCRFERDSRASQQMQAYVAECLTRCAPWGIEHTVAEKFDRYSAADVAAISGDSKEESRAEWRRFHTAICPTCFAALLHGIAVAPQPPWIPRFRREGGADGMNGWRKSELTGEEMREALSRVTRERERRRGWSSGKLAVWVDGERRGTVECTLQLSLLLPQSAEMMHITPAEDPTLVLAAHLLSGDPDGPMERNEVDLVMGDVSLSITIEGGGAGVGTVNLRVACEGALAAMTRKLRDGIGLSVAEVGYLLGSLGHRDPEYARRATRILPRLWNDARDCVARALSSLLEAQETTVAAAILPQLHSAEVLNCRDFCQPVTTEWLTEAAREFQLLAESEHVRLFVTRFAADEAPFKGVLIHSKSNPRDYVIGVHNRVPDTEVPEVIFHELKHLCEYLDKEAPASAEFHDSGFQQGTLFALAARRIDQVYKAVATQWAGNEMRFTTGGAVVLDAGSQCRQMGLAITKLLIDGSYSMMTVVTNNHQVLQDWVEALARHPQLASSHIKLLGDVFDVDHLAYYGNTLRDKLTSPEFRPSHGFIGASGIEIDPDGHILIGYHGGPDEKMAKESLFSCCCTEARVILATPLKIGHPRSGYVFDLVSMPSINTRTPIYLVTVQAPTAADAERFQQVRNALSTPAMAAALRKAKIDFRWVLLDAESGKEVEQIRVPGAMTLEAKTEVDVVL
jgi:hypothetical protein